MRKDARTENNVNIPRLNGYHYGRYESLKAFNSDRPILLNDDYSVSSANTPSVLSITKANTHLPVFGLEVETENHEVDNSTINVNLLTMIFEKLFIKDLWKCESDGSLGYGGVECITQPMTKAFIRNNYKNFKTMWNEYFPAFGISTKNENCGMHVSIDMVMLGKTREEQEENAKKLYYLVNKHFNFFTVAFSRTNGTYWCGQCSDWQNIKDENFNTHRWSGSHNYCMNYSHFRTGRLEIRLVGGQKNFECFRNTMEVVFHITQSIKKLSWNDLDKLEKVFKGCNQYVFDRLTRCRNERVLSQDILDKVEPTIKRVDW